MSEPGMVLQYGSALSNPAMFAMLGDYENRKEREKIARASARRKWWKDLFESWRGIHIR